MKDLILCQLPLLSGQATNPLRVTFDHFKLTSVSKIQGIAEYIPLCRCLDQSEMVHPRIRNRQGSLRSCINLHSYCSIICQFALNFTRIYRSFPNEERSFCCLAPPRVGITLKKTGFNYWWLVDWFVNLKEEFNDDYWFSISWLIREIAYYFENAFRILQDNSFLMVGIKSIN